MINEINATTSSLGWNPAIIELIIKDLAWPLTVLILGWRLRGGIISALTNLFSKNDVAEFSATATGVTAKFRVTEQSSNNSAQIDGKNFILPASTTYEDIKKKHQEFETDFSEILKESIQGHINALSVSDEDKLQLLATELSLLQSALTYNDINKVLFRSQYDMFENKLYPNKSITYDEVQVYFQQVKTNVEHGLEDWDYIKYLAYPSTNKIVESNERSISLTVLGRSYMQFMHKNPQLITELSKL